MKLSTAVGAIAALLSAAFAAPTSSHFAGDNSASAAIDPYTVAMYAEEYGMTLDDPKKLNKRKTPGKAPWYHRGLFKNCGKVPITHWGWEPCCQDAAGSEVSCDTKYSIGLSEWRDD